MSEVLGSHVWNAMFPGLGSVNQIYELQGPKDYQSTIDDDPDSRMVPKINDGVESGIDRVRVLGLLILTLLLH